MSAPLPQIDFSRIRQHESSQQRAWEELSYLLVPDIVRLPVGTALERKAAPDGGIEFSCLAPLGKGQGRWAWQAKFLFRLDKSAFNQMTESVKSALETTPDLERYTFILPIDRSGRKSPRGMSGEERWCHKVAAWQTIAVARGMEVRFDYIGHSDIVTALQAQKHAGALRYFFDKNLLTNEFFRRQVAREIDNLGERYDPAVHVDLEIGEFFDAVCRSSGFVQRVAEIFSDVARNGGPLQGAPGENDQLATAITKANHWFRSVTATFQASKNRIGIPDAMVFAELERTVRLYVDQLALVETHCQQIRDELRKDTYAESIASAARLRPTKRRRVTGSSTDSAVDDRTKALYKFEAQVWQSHRIASNALRLLTSSQVIAAKCAALLIEVPAGCGKSHIVADVAKGRTDQGMPTVLILGQHLTTRSIWQQIAEVVELDLTGPEFLQVLEVATRIRGGGRALILVDAINEGAGAELWPDRLAGFLREVAEYPWVAVVLTVRDTYTKALIPSTLPDNALVRVTHPGLSGHEEEALIRYTQRYQIRLPDIPSLLPEFTNPLFLRSLCRSVNARGLSAIPREAASLTWVFSGLLEDVNGRLSDHRRLDVDPADYLIQRAVHALAGAMLDIDGEALPLLAAKEICEGLHPERRLSKSLLQGLFAEGVLLRERAHSGESPDAKFVEQVRFTYQRLADHLRAEALLDRYPTNEKLSNAVLDLASGDHAWSRTGLIEALVLLVSERRGIELADLLRLKPANQRLDRLPARRTRSQAAARRAWLGSVLERSFFTTLAWRAPRSITQQTQELATRYFAAGVVSSSEWLSLLLGLACVPDHPLNMLRIDGALRRMVMPERDIRWSDEVLDIWAEDTNPIARTIDWVWSGSVQPPMEVAQLASTLLAWLFTSPNRRLRDAATKALLRLVENKTGLLVDLLGRFSDVDDPYVIERLLAVACGHAVRHRWLPPSDAFLNDFSDLGRCAFDLAFTRTSIPEHLLIRHYAQACAEVVHNTLATHGWQFERDIAWAKPPYQSSWPLTAPSLRELAQRYGHKGKYFSAASMLGYDFEHDVIERGIETSFVLPGQARRQAARRAATQRRLTKLREAIACSVSPRRRGQILKQINNLLSTDDATTNWLGWEILRAELPAQEDPVRELESVARGLKFEGRNPIRPKPDMLARWIGERVLNLGWTEERFGKRDRRLASARNSGWSETEPFGRKYAWIAFYQMLGHLADHCMLQEEWLTSNPESYEGPWQVSDAIDIDPTILLRGDEPPKDTPAARARKLRIRHERDDAWWLTGYNHSLVTFGDDTDWLNDTNDVPRPEPLLAVRDHHGCEWLVLESHARWTVPSSDGLKTYRRELWVRTQANLVPIEHEQRLCHWASEQNWMGLWMPTPSGHPTGFLGGYPDLPPWPTEIGLIDAENRGDDENLIGLGTGWVSAGRRTGSKEQNFPLALATMDYGARASRDLSAIDLPRAILPSPLLLDLLQARWAGAETTPSRDLALGPVETEYSWLASGDVVAFSSDGRKFGSTMMLCVRAEPLRQALVNAGLGLWSWLLGEKIYWTGHAPSSDRADIFGALGLTSSLRVWGLTIEYCERKSRSEVRRRLKRERSGGG